MGLTELVKGKLAELKAAHVRRVAASEARYTERMKAAKTRLQQEKVKAQRQREKLQLERELYEAQAAVKRERAALDEARRASGNLTWSERLSKIGRDLAGSGKKLSSGSAKATKGRKSGKSKSARDSFFSEPKPIKRAAKSKGRGRKRKRSGDGLDDIFDNPLR